MTTVGKALAAHCDGCSQVVWAAIDEPAFHARAQKLRETGHSIDLLYIDHIPPVHGCKCRRTRKKRGRK